MIFESSIYNALSPMIEPKFKLFFADKGYPEPKSPYCMISCIDSRNVGLPNKTYSIKGTQRLEQISQVKEVNISLTFQYDPKQETLQEYVEDFHTGLGFSNNEWLFGSNGIGLVSYEDILYMFAQVDNTTAYRRATVDLLLRIERTITSETPVIKEVEFKGDLETYDFEYTYDAENNKYKGA